jgi:hypothetical protein
MRIIGFFCEDIRREMANTDSIVGILPDNMILDSAPATIPKLGIYARAQIDPDEVLHSIELILHTPWGEPRLLTEAEISLLEKSQKGARDNDLPFGGIILRALLRPFEVRTHGMIRVVAKMADTEITCAFLNIRPPPTTSTASSPPPGQSPSAAPAT